MRNPSFSLIKVRFLVIIYTILCVLTLLFSRNFFIETLNGNTPASPQLIVFFSIPVILLVFLGFLVFQVLKESIQRKPGSRFNIKLLAYFSVIVIFSITPITVMTSIALNQMVNFWHTIDDPIDHSEKINGQQRINN